MPSNLEKIVQNMKALKIPLSKAKKILTGFKGAKKLREQYAIPATQSSTQIASPQPPTSPPPSPNGAVTLALRDDMSDWNAGKGSNVRATKDGVVLTFPKGKWASGGGTNLKFKPDGYKPSESVELRYDIFIPKDFDFVKGGKIGVGVNVGGGTGGKDWDVDDGSFRLMWRRGGQLVGYCYLPQNMGKYVPEKLTCPLLNAQPDEFIEAIGKKAPAAGLDVFRYTKQKLWLKKGQWNSIRMRAVMNDVGKKNGVLEIELNGECLRTPIVWRGKRTDRFEQLQLANWFGGGDRSYAPTKDETVTIRKLRVTFE